MNVSGAGALRNDGPADNGPLDSPGAQSDAATMSPVPPADPEAPTLAPRNGQLPSPAIVDKFASPASESATLSPAEASASSSQAGLPSVPGYEVLAVLGRGGMGVVYKARQVALGRLVALKMVLAGGQAGEQELARFRIEAQAIARLRHAHIVQIYEVGDYEGLPYFSLELCEGGSLAGKLNGTPWQATAAAQMVEALARAMAVVHQAGIVHRDLKPANVLLLADGQPRITDFGLAKRLEEASQTTQGAVMGTPSYMSPEQAGGQSAQIGPACDVYALGAILYELLTGRPPFRAATALDTILQVVAEEPVPPTRLVPQCPRDLETICLKCLQKEPEKRYATAEALAEDLRRFQAGEPIAARPATAWERLAKWARRRPVVAGLVAAVILLTLAGAGGITWAYCLALHERDRAREQESLVRQEKAVADEQRGRAEKSEAEARTARDKAEEQRGRAQHQLDRARRHLMTTQLLRVAAIDERDPGLAQQLLLDKTACPDDLHDFTWGYYKNACKRELLVLRDHPDTVRVVAFSPDGQTLAVAGGQAGPGFVRTYALHTGQKLTAPEGHDRPVSALCFSSDDKDLLATAEDGSLKRWDLQTGKEQPCPGGSGGAQRSTAFTSNGTRMAMGEKDGSVRLVDLSTGRPCGLLKGHARPVRCMTFSRDGKALASAAWDNSLRVWDVTGQKEQLNLPGAIAEPAGTEVLAFAPDGKRLAVPGFAVVRVLEVATGREVLRLPVRATAVTFSPDGRHLATGGADGIVGLWDTSTGTLEATLRGHNYSVMPSRAVTSVAFSPDGKALASASMDRTVWLWDARTGPGQPTLWMVKTSPVNSVAFSPNGTTVASGGSNPGGQGDVVLWDAETGHKRASLAGHTGAVRAVAFSPDGKALASAGWDGTIRLWDGVSGRELGSLGGPGQSVAALAFSPDGKALASGGGDLTVRTWDLGTRTQRWASKGLTGEVACLAFSPNGKTVASGGEPDGTIRFWAPDTGQQQGALKGHQSPVRSLFFSSDSKALVSGAEDAFGRKETKLWDLMAGKERQSIPDTGSALALTRDDGVLAAVSGTDVKLWEFATVAERLTLRGAAGCLAFSPEGRRLVTASPDGTIRLWDARTGSNAK